MQETTLGLRRHDHATGTNRDGGREMRRLTKAKTGRQKERRKRRDTNGEGHEFTRAITDAKSRLQPLRFRCFLVCHSERGFCSAKRSKTTVDGSLSSSVAIGSARHSHRASASSAELPESVRACPTASVNCGIQTSRGLNGSPARIHSTNSPRCHPEEGVLCPTKDP
jgi:hypothetical protein